MCVCVGRWAGGRVEAAVYASVFTYYIQSTAFCASVFVCVGVCTHVITFLCLPLCVPVHTCTCTFACVCECVCGWVIAPLVCGVCVERQSSLVPILYRLLISECVVAKCFLFLFSSRESIPWFLSVPRGRTRPPHMSRYLCVYTISYS